MVMRDHARRRDGTCQAGSRTVATQLVRVGVIGLGRVSPSHIAAYEAAGNARVVAVCDSDAATMESLAERLKVPGYTDYREVIADAAVDGVAVLLPHELHYPVACAALEARKHVCLEKPMAVSTEQCNALIVLARRQGRTLSVTNNTRFAAPYAQARRLVLDGKLGQVQLVRVLMAGNETDGFLSTDPRDLWRRQRNGIGALIDCASHYFYLLGWLFGDVKGIRAVARNVLEGMGVEDYALVSGEFAGGGGFTIEVDLTALIPWQERVEIFGSAGSLVIDHLADPPAVFYAGSKDRVGSPLAGVPYDPRGWRDASIAGAVDDFLDAAATGRDLSDDLRHAAYAVTLVERAYASVAAGGASVEV